MLLDLKWKGRDRKLVVQANRNAFFYVLDRETGEFLMGKPFARQTWAKELDAKGGRILMPNTEPTPEGTRLCPGVGGRGQLDGAFVQSANRPVLFRRARTVRCRTITRPPVYMEGKPYWGSVFRGVTDEKEWGMLKALDPL